MLVAEVLHNYKQANKQLFSDFGKSNLICSLPAEMSFASCVYDEAAVF
jgi:hypothetical protein